MRKLARTNTDNFLVSRIWSEIVSGILANADLVVTRAYGLQLVGKRLDIETVDQLVPLVNVHLQFEILAFPISQVMRHYSPFGFGHPGCALRVRGYLQSQTEQRQKKDGSNP